MPWAYAGGVLQGFMFPFNLGRLGNGISWWLGIHPYELFFYIFLPPLLCDSAVRIDFFLFKQVWKTLKGPCILCNQKHLQLSTITVLVKRVSACNAYVGCRVSISSWKAACRLPHAVHVTH